ncbi:LLM class flavin-dependent oxidoreductase [Streptomyces sp. NPDC048425]|uniref:LLM class flavin-dependent oxidoreductase n=1 Tax=Streptomyces sp. NPDC048425 TaxID=3365548 RepID=UPI0037237E96
MRVDILHSFSNSGNVRPWRDVLEQARRRIKLADELGLDGFWLGEHHFDHAGIDQSPNPAMLMADLASRTSRIRIGIAAIILPLWHPVRLAEDLAMLDHMSIIPRPVQPGGPPLFSVTDTVGGFVGAARQGLNVITWFPTRGVLDGLNSAYQAELDRAETPNPALARSSAILRGCLIAPTDAEARDLTEAQVDENFAFIDKVRGLKIWLDQGEDPDDPSIRAQKPFDLLFERDHLLIGSPETVAEKMIQITRTQNVDHWLLSNYRDEDDAYVDRSLHLLATEVLPKVRAALGR